MTAAELKELQSIIVACALERLLEETYGHGNSGFRANSVDSLASSAERYSGDVICSTVASCDIWDGTVLNVQPPPSRTRGGM